MGHRITFNSVEYMPVSEHKAEVDGRQRSINDLTERLVDAEAENCQLRVEILHLVGTASTVRSARKVAERFREMEAEVVRLREAIKAALRTTWTEDDDGGWGTYEDQLHPDDLAALGALVPHWTRWGDQAWGAAGRAESQLARLREIEKVARALADAVDGQYGPFWDHTQIGAPYANFRRALAGVSDE
jgi:hypothetical protein